MGFDDLAKRMGAKRSRKSPDQIIAEAAKADERMSRQSDLILGALLIAGGGVVALLVLNVESEGGRMDSILVASIGAILAGLAKFIRGIIR
jgi:hypothetical protein